MSNRENLRSNIMGFVFLAILSIPVFCLNNIVLYMLYSVVEFSVIFAKAKYSFFSAISFILVFSLFQSMIQALTGKAYGMIQNSKAGIPLYEGIHGTCTITFLLVEIFFVLFTTMIEDEKALYRTEIILTNFSAVFLILAAILIIILMFPSFPDFQLHIETRRTQGVMKNYGWVLTALVLAGVTIDKSKEIKELWLGYFFLIFWIFGHSERVEGLGFVVYITLKVLNRNYIAPKNENSGIASNASGGGEKEKTTTLGFKKRVGVLIIIFCLLIFLVWLGLYRDSFRTGHSDYSMSNILRKLFVQSTAGDVVYVFDCAVHMWKHDKLVLGKTYLSWLLNLIPGAGNELNAGSYIRNYYFTMGGALFFTEPMMNFGIIGVYVTNIVFFLWYSFIVKKPTVLRAMMFMPMIIEIFRTTWYGRNGWELASFVEIPLLYLGITMVTNRISITKK